MASVICSSFYLQRVHLVCCNRLLLATQLVESLRSNASSSLDGESSAIDFDWLHVIGSGIDGIDVPEHKSSREEIQHLVEAVCAVLRTAGQPAAITIARYNSITVVDGDIIILSNILFYVLRYESYYNLLECLLCF